VSAVRSGIEEVLRGLAQPLVGVTALAAGADQVFAKTVLGMGGNLRVIVPSRRYEEAFSSQAAVASYKRLLARAQEVERLNFAEPSETAFLAAGRRVVDCSDVLVAVWDGEPARGSGGTADVVAYAQRVPKVVHVVWPPGLSR
jgi:hypothetical protein